jgi:hypothetical protein
METRIILCIPGRWADRSEIVTSLAGANAQEYLFAGNILLHIPSGEGFEVEIEAHDAQMQQSFTLAAQGRLSDDELQEIGRHTFVVYLIGKGGNMQHAAGTMRAGNAFLKAGGLAMKVETAGKSFSKEQWTLLSDAGEEQALYEAYVVLLQSEDELIYSCGMHNIGLRDVICDVDATVNEAAQLADIFNIYQVIEKPGISEGQTFSTEADGPVYRITTEVCTIYPEDDLFYNPFGMYRLQEVTE